MYYIGIDLGTSAIKLLLMEGNGKICNIVSKEYPLSFPNPGWSEQNPYDWYDQMIAGIKELVNGFDTTKVAGISFADRCTVLLFLMKMTMLSVRLFFGMMDVQQKKLII